MGHTRITVDVDVYSCPCGWTGVDPVTKRVAALEEGQLGRLALGSRSGRAYLRYDCPLCQRPIEASPPVELLRVASIDDLAGGNGAAGRKATAASPPAPSHPVWADAPLAEE